MSGQLSAGALRDDQSQSTFEIPRRRPVERDESPREAIIDAVATAENIDKESLPPLEETVEADCLDELAEVTSGTIAGGLVFTRTEEIATEIELSFQFVGYDVTATENYVVLE